MKMPKLLWALPLSLAMLGAAHARGVYWSMDVGTPGVSVGVGNAPRVYAPPPVYVQPAPIYAPPPVYVAPPPVYVRPSRPSVYVEPAPPPVVIYEQPTYGGYYGQPYGGGRYYDWRPTRGEDKSGTSNRR